MLLYSFHFEIFLPLLNCRSLRINCLSHMVAFISDFEAWLWSLKDAILYIREEQGLIIVLFLLYFFIFLLHVTRLFVSESGNGLFWIH